MTGTLVVDNFCANPKRIYCAKRLGRGGFVVYSYYNLNIGATQFGLNNVRRKVAHCSSICKRRYYPDFVEGGGLRGEKVDKYAAHFIIGLYDDISFHRDSSKAAT